MEIMLTPELEELVKQKVASGTFNSPSEVVQASLRLLKRQDDVTRIELEELRREIMKGVEQSQRGESKPLDVKKIKQEGRKCLGKKCEMA